MISKLISISGSIAPHDHARMHVNEWMFVFAIHRNESWAKRQRVEWNKIPHTVKVPTKVRASLNLYTCKFLLQNELQNELKLMQNPTSKWIHELMHNVVKIHSIMANAHGVATCSTNITCGTTICTEIDDTTNRCINSCKYYHRCEYNDIPK